MTLTEHARNIRRNILDVGYKAGAMHFGGSLSIADILAYLYGEQMHYDVQKPEWEGRDRFVLSKGHCGLALYAALAEFGFLTHEQLMTVDDNGGLFPSHCVKHVEYGIELSSGSLGLGLSFAIGQALGVQSAECGVQSAECGVPSAECLVPSAVESNNRTLEQSNNLPQLYVIAGNGEINEGSFWEAAMFAGAKGVSNVCVIIDDNGMQLDGLSKDVMPVTNWGERLAAFGWKVASAKGHDFDSIRAAFQTPREGQPLAIIAKTVKGKGVSFMENEPVWHHNKMSEAQYHDALQEIEQSSLIQSNNQTIEHSNNFPSNNSPSSNRTIEPSNHRTIEPFSFDLRSSMELSRLATRGVFGKALADIEPEMPDLRVVVADVGSSARVMEIAAKAPDKFVNVGIAEQDMVGIAAGLASTGKTVFVSSFASFASMRCFEMLRTQVGYMNLNVKVASLMSGMANGTVGNTHYGLEDIALMRTIPNMTVICPCDPFETYKATQAAAKMQGPVYLRLTGVNGFAPVYKTDFDFEIGKANIVLSGKDVALVATGTMVAECVRAARGLARQGITPTVVDMHTIKPLDTACLDRLFAAYKLLISVEEHFTIGGLGAAIAEYKADKVGAPPLKMLGIPNQFQKVGAYSYMLDLCGLTANKIAGEVQKCLVRSA